MDIAEARAPRWQAPVFGCVTRTAFRADGSPLRVHGGLYKMYEKEADRVAIGLSLSRDRN
jgi:hypothetical protein